MSIKNIIYLPEKRQIKESLIYEILDIANNKDYKKK